MAKVTNDDLIKSIVKEMPAEHAEKLQIKNESTGEKTTITDPAKLLSIMEQYPTTKNSFIDTLVNKVGKTLVFSKAYSNPLKALKKGKLEYGDSIEEIFVQMAQSKNFGEHWGDSTTTEGDLIRELKPIVSALYLKKNFDKKFKTTIKDKDLIKAFYNSTGLSTLIQAIATSLQNGLNYLEYKYTKQTLTKFIGAGEILKDAPNAEGDLYQPVGTLKQEILSMQVNGTTNKEIGLDLTEKIRAVAGNMQFMTDKYNVAKEITFSNPENLVIYTTPDTQALLDVNVIASAFNVSAANLNTKTVLVDEMPKTIYQSEAPIEGEVLAILADEDFLQVWDTYQSMGTFNNPEGQYTNYFASAEGIFAVCLFANVCVFYKA